MRHPRLLLTLVPCALLAASCSPAGAPATTPAPAATPAPTTTQQATTTLPPRTVVAEGDLPDELMTALGAFYNWLADERNPEPPAPPAMIAALAGAGHVVADAPVVTGVFREIDGDNSVAVVHVGGDVVFMVKDDRPWRIAGTNLAGEEPWLGGSPRLLLVLGSDARQGENQRRLRADSIHIVGIDPGRAAGSILGFPRDAWVQGPDGRSKFTNVMSGRGPEVMLETAETLTGLDLDGYVVTGFAGFEGLIGDVGGLVIDLPKAIKSGIEGWDDYPSGVQKLGPTALLRLARIRKTLNGGDFARSANHGLIMQAGMVLTQEMGVDELPELLEILLDHVWTDLSTEDLLTMAASVYVLTPEEMVNMVLPGSVGTAGRESVVFLAKSAADVYTDLADGVIDSP